MDIRSVRAESEWRLSDVDAILVDLDGTVLDWTSSVESALRQWLPDIGIAPSQEAITLWFELEKKYSYKTNGLPESRRLRLTALATEYGVTLPAAALDRVFADYLETCHRNYRLFPDALPFLETLRDNDIPVGVVTNGPRAVQERKVTDCGLRPFVRFVLAGDSPGHCKPHADFFAVAVGMFGGQLSNPVVIGDDFETDVAGAVAAGLTAIHLTRTPRADVDHLYTAQSLAELETCAVGI
ncbi:HAD family hydrolase [Nocardia arizonensis]|uniref:HAD family hydrolase n=1 Tax=Nocardia arizonensis TaxID=1141647 RepID=UPI0006CF9966|nr:HAD family hydrolase [Nocardia arizonensis]